MIKSPQHENSITIAVVGHSPKDIGGYCENNPTRLWVRNSLYDVLLDIKNEYNKKNIAIRMANSVTQGVCVEAAIVAMALTIPVDCYIVKGLEYQSRKWRKKTRDSWLKLINSLMDTGGTLDISSKTSDGRDNLILDKADLGISVLNSGIYSGSTLCVTRLMENIMPVTIISPDTQMVYYGKIDNR